MSDPRPEQLIRAEALIYYGKVREVLKFTVNFEKKNKITSNEQLWVLLLRGFIYANKLQFKKAVEVGEHAYSKSLELELVPESIDALILKAHVAFLGEIDEAENCVLEAEKLLNNLTANKHFNLSRYNIILLQMKSWIGFIKGEFRSSLKLVLQGLELAEKTEMKTTIGYLLFLTSTNYTGLGENDIALEYSVRSLEVMEKLGFQTGIANSLYLIGSIYLNKGNINKALEFSNEALSIEQLSDINKVSTLLNVGNIYSVKGLLDMALKCFKEGLVLAEEIKHHLNIGAILYGIGIIYRQKSDLVQAKKYLELSLTHFEKMGFELGLASPLLYLQFINLDEGSIEQAKGYLSRLEELADQSKNKIIKQANQLGKAFILRASNRMRNNIKAEEYLKQIVENPIVKPNFYTLALISLCDFYLEELSMYNNAEILEEIHPLITRLLNMAEKQNSFLWLVEGKLLQAKLALIEMKIENAKKLLTEAQQIAELRGLKLLAQKISSEHDVLLERLDEWDRLKKEDAPMAERIKLASFGGILNRLQGRQALEPPELVDEVPILLLIMDNSGVPYFNYSFASEWDSEGIFSSFISAFNTFSSELFSESIDRIRIGENVILLNPIESFLACYVIKGQSYPALQKLTRFTKSIRENSEIWQALNKSVKTSEMLGLDRPSALKTVINEIFTK